MKQGLLFDDERLVQVYVGCALTHAPKEFKDAVEDFKKQLNEFCIVLEFLGLTAGTPRDVWVHDIERCVMCCDLFIAISDHPSIGLGVELAVQIVHRKKPAIVVAQEDLRITRLILDPEVEGDFQFVTYKHLSDLIPLIKAKVATIQEKIILEGQIAEEQVLSTPIFPNMLHLCVPTVPFGIHPSDLSSAA